MKSLLRFGVLLGLLITLAGFVSYYLFFVQYPKLRDFPWVNLPLTVLGAVLALAGLIAIWKGASTVKRIFGFLGFLISAAVLALFCFYVFHFSYQMPGETEQTKNLNTLPAASLHDVSGNRIDLASLSGENGLLLSFYRGHW